MAKRPPSRAPAAPPKNADEGSNALLPLVLKLFHRPDGDAADWELIAGSLFRVGLHALDKMPEERQRAFIDRLQVRFYERIEAAAKIDLAASKTEPPGAVSAFANTAGPKSKGPRPPR